MMMMMMMIYSSRWTFSRVQITLPSLSCLRPIPGAPHCVYEGSFSRSTVFCSPLGGHNPPPPFVSPVLLMSSICFWIWSCHFVSPQPPCSLAWPSSLVLSVWAFPGLPLLLVLGFIPPCLPALFGPLYTGCWVLVPVVWFKSQNQK